MADYGFELDAITSVQAAHEVTANNADDEASSARLFGRRAVTTAGLTWGVRGGRFNGTSIANATVSLTASNTNYVVIHRTTLVASVSTATTNWNNATTYGRAYKIVAGATTITSYEDHRGGTAGILFPDTSAFGSGTVTSVNITQPAAGITASGGPVTTSGSITLALANDLSALEGLSSTGFAKRTGTDTWSVGAVDLSSSDATGTIAAARMPALTGDITTSAGAVATTLATVNSNVGSFGDGTHVAAVTVNAKGLVTAASSVVITGAAPSGSAGGDLTGTYPNPTIDTGKVTNAKLADMTAHTFKARKTNSTGAPEDATATEATALLDAVVGDSGSGGTKGLVPAPAAGDAAAGKFLKANGTFAVPPGTGSSDCVKLAVVVTASSQSTITFSSISGSYTHLKILFSGRDTSSGVNDSGLKIKLNSDATSGNYTASVFLYNNSTTSSAAINPAASSAGAEIGRLPGTLGGQANAVSCVEITIPNYAGTTFYKPMHSQTTEFSGNAIPVFAMPGGAVWKSTAAITDIVLTAGGTAFVDGSTATLYGMT